MWLKRVTAEETIPTDALVVDYNNDHEEYVIYKPGDRSQYLVRLIDKKLGFAPRFKFTEALDALKTAYPERVPMYEMDFQKIPTLSGPLVKQRGWLNLPKQKYKRTTEENIKDMRKRYLGTSPSPIGWEQFAGPSTEETYKEINRPEENWEISHL